MQKDTSPKLRCFSGLVKRGVWLAVGCVALSVLASGNALAAGTGEKTKKVTKTVKVVLEPNVVYKLTRELPCGRVRKVQNGEPGEVVKTLEITKLLNHVVSKKVLHQDITPAKDAIYLMGKGGYAPSRHSFYRRDVRTMRATAYDPSPGQNGGHRGRTCTGRTAKFGIIAVDPRVIPFGTLMYVEGYGFGIAGDRGSAIKGNHIDLCYDSHRTALRYGSHMVKVHILASR